MLLMYLVKDPGYCDEPDEYTLKKNPDRYKLSIPVAIIPLNGSEERDLSDLFFG